MKITIKMSNEELSVSIDEHIEEESNETLTDTMEILTSSLRGLNTRKLPNWDINIKKRDSIKEHLHTAKQLGQRLGWTNKELANEVMLSLRGESRTVARNFSDKIQNDFKLLEKELEKFFFVAKPKGQILKEFNSLKWNSNRQTLQEFGVTLRSKLMKIFRSDTEEFDLKLRDRFLEAIKEIQPEFGFRLEMLDLESKSEFMDLVCYAQSKFNIYKMNEQMVEEDQIFLTKEFKQITKKKTSNQNGSRLEQYDPNENVRAFEDNQTKSQNRNEGSQENEDIEMTYQRYSDDEYSRNYDFGRWRIPREFDYNNGHLCTNQENRYNETYNNYGKFERNQIQEIDDENEQYRQEQWSENQQDNFLYEQLNYNGENGTQRYQMENRGQQEFPNENDYGRRNPDYPE